jgi:hypothetical protein
MHGWKVGLLGLALGLALSSTASAAPITKTPGSVGIHSVVGIDFTLSFDGGDTSDNMLDFTLAGAGGCGGFCPSTAVAAMVFDDVDVLAAGDENSGFFDPDNVIRKLSTPGGIVAALLVDLGGPNLESFWLQLSDAPTSATIYALALDNINGIHGSDEFLGCIVESTRVSFSPSGGPSTPNPSPTVPEPSAALVFAAGLVAAHRRLRRPR